MLRPRAPGHPRAAEGPAFLNLPNAHLGPHHVQNSLIINPFCLPPYFLKIPSRKKIKESSGFTVSNNSTCGKRPQLCRHPDER